MKSKQVWSTHIQYTHTISNRKSTWQAWRSPVGLQKHRTVEHAYAATTHTEHKRCRKHQRRAHKDGTPNQGAQKCREYKRKSHTRRAHERRLQGRGGRPHPVSDNRVWFTHRHTQRSLCSHTDISLFLLAAKVVGLILA